MQKIKEGIKIFEVNRATYLSLNFSKILPLPEALSVPN